MPFHLASSERSVLRRQVRRPAGDRSLLSRRRRTLKLMVEECERRVMMTTDLGWSGGGITAGATADTQFGAVVARTYTVSGAAAPSDFTIAYFASKDATYAGGGTDILIGQETVSASADKTVGTHAGFSPVLQLPDAGTYHVFAVLDPSNAVAESDETNNVAAAPAAVVVSNAGAVVLDNGAPQYAEAPSGAWSTIPSAGYGGTVRTAPVGTGSDTASWTLAAGTLAEGTYDVQATWAAQPGLSTATPYRIYQGSTLLKTVTVDQTHAPSGAVTAGGATFQDLGSVTLIGAGALQIVVGNDAGAGTGGSVEADAVRVAAVPFEGVTFPVGSGAHVVIPNEPALQFTSAQSYTLTAWADPSQPASGVWQGIVTKGRDTGSWYGLWISDTGQWTGGSPSGSLTGPAATPGWHHLALVQDGTAGTRTLYVDGVAVATGTAQPASSLGNLVVGGSLGATEPFAGSVADVRVYNSALTPAQFVSGASPVGKWAFNETSGAVAHDTAGGDDGTITTGALLNANGSGLVLTATVRDLHTSFSDVEQPATGVVGGLLQTTLSADGTPVFIGTPGIAHIASASSFYDWYHDVPGVNATTSIPLALFQTSAGSGTESYQNDGSFFPIDNVLFGNEGDAHNQDLTVQLHATFTYHGGESVSLTTADDGWLFINGRLALDNGGIHVPTTKSVSVDSLGLTVGQTYAFDLFYADRLSGGSTFDLQTNLALTQNAAPPVVPPPSVVAGFVYGDANDNGLFDPGETPIAGSGVQLLNSTGTVVGTATTDANGHYVLAAGVSPTPATLTETLNFPATLTSFNQVGSIPRFDPTLGVLSSIDVTYNGSITSEFYAENLSSVSPSTVATAFGGTLFLEWLSVANGLNTPTVTRTVNLGAYDGVTDYAGHSGYSSGPVTSSVSLTTNLTAAAVLALYTGTGDVNFSVAGSASSSASATNGNTAYFSSTKGAASVTFVYHYSPFVSLAAGNYTVVQGGEPAGYLDGLDSSNGVVLPNSAGTDSIPVTLPAGGSSLANNFGEVRPTSLAGHAFYDVHNDGVFGADDTGVGGVTVTLSGTNDLGLSISVTTTTRADGSYYFAALRPGTYSLTEFASAGVITGKTTAGTLGGTAGSGRVTVITVNGGSGTGYDFGFDRPPVIPTNPGTTIAAGQAYGYQVGATDPDGDPLTYKLLTGPAGLGFAPGTPGLLTWTPSSSDSQSYPVSVLVSDGRGGTAEKDFTLTATGGTTNRPPVFTSTPVVDAYVGTPYLYHATAYDPDSDPLTFSRNSALSNTPSGMVMPDGGPTSPAAGDPSAGIVQWTPTPAQAGQLFPVEILVNDGHGHSVAQDYQVLVHPEPGNSPPVITSLPVTTAYPSATYLYSVVADDPDHDALTYHLDNGPSGMSINPTTGLITWVAPSPFNYPVPVTVSVTDTAGGKDSQTYRIAPTGSDVVASADSGGVVGFSPYPAAPGDPNPENTLLATAGSGVFPNPFVPPNVGAFGTNTPSVDGQPILNSNPLNTTGFYRVDFNLATLTSSLRLIVTANADDHAAVYLNGHQLTDSSNNPWAFNEFGTNTIIDTASQWLVQGRNELLFVVDNSGGGPTGLSFEADVLQADANLAPHINSAPPTSANANEPFEYLVRATDLDGDVLTYSLAPGSSGGTVPTGMTIDPISGLITWTPTRAQLGTQSVTAVVTDPGGLSDTQAVPILVGTDSGSDSPPQLLNTPGFDALVGSPFTFTAIGFDPDGDPVRYSLPVAPQGMVIDPISGNLRWTPTREQVGTQSFLLVLSDGKGGSTPYAFSVHVPGNQAPVFTSPATGVAAVGVSNTFPVSAYDPDGDPVTFSTDPIFKLPPGVTLNQSLGLLLWTPTQAGTIPVVVDASDGTLTTTQTILLTAVSPTTVTLAITSGYRTTIQAGRTYLYQVATNAPSGDAVSYTVAADPAATASPSGVTVSPDGLVRWATPAHPTSLDPSSPSDVYSFVVTAHDARGAQASKTVYVSLTTQETNRSPVIGPPAPLTTATVGQRYFFVPAATDPDNDPLAWSLASTPVAGLAVDPVTGALSWTPTADQIGTQPVALRVEDGQGGLATESFAINVGGANLPPAFLTVQPPDAVLHAAGYTFQVPAYDPEGGPLTYSLVGFAGFNYPSTMSVDSATGVISWTDPSPTGSTNVTVQATDSQGASSSQQFTFVVDPVGGVTRPTITGNPPQTWSTAATYDYQFAVSAGVTPALSSDTQGAWAITADPSLPNTWHLKSTGTGGSPAPEPAGSYRVGITAGNGNGTTSQYFTVRVAADQAPTLAPLAAVTVSRGATLVDTASASDPDLATDPNESLSYGIDAPAAIDGSGRITWTPGASDALGSHTFNVTVTDAYGRSATQTLQVNVVADNASPTVQLVYSPNPVFVNQPETILVSASDYVGVANLSLTVNGVPVALDSHGAGTLTEVTPGSYSVVATATDAAGNVGRATGSLLVVGAGGPNVAIASPAAQATVKVPTRITGTVSDAALVDYTLSYAPVNGGAFTTFYTYYANPDHSPGNVNIGNGVLDPSDGSPSDGFFDPTLLADGAYDIRLTATNAGGLTAISDQTVNVAGNLKLGNLHLSFTDLTIPVAGIPITITRTYDTLNANKVGDFGYGWTLGEGDFQLQVSQPDGSLAPQGELTPFSDYTHIMITRPGHAPEGFTFFGEPEGYGPFEGGDLAYSNSLFHPTFVPDPGVTDTLTVPDAELTLENGTYTNESYGGDPYNPADDGGSYTLTTQNGNTYNLDASTGKLSTVTDLNGNSLTFSSTGITSSTGVQVTFQRDAQGRIKSITDPRGDLINYVYDPVTGDLTSATDRDGNKTQFFYSPDTPHYLTYVIDPSGRKVAQVTYTNGRVSGLADASGNSSNLSYNLGALSETVTPPSVNGTASPSSTLTYDALGHVIGTSDALGNSSSAFYTGTNLTSQSQTVGTQTLTTHYTYDPTTGQVATATDAAGHQSTYTYGAFGLPATVSDAMGNTTTLGYDGKGNLTSTTSPGGVKTSSTYTASGQVATSTTPDGTTSYTYYTAGQTGGNVGDVASVTDTRGVTTFYTYDKNDNQTSTVTIAVDPTVNTGVANAVPSSFFGPGTLLTQTTAGGLVTDTIHDALGRVVWTDAAHAIGLPATGTRTTYDAASTPTTATLQRVTITATASVYDGNDQLIQTTDPLGAVTDTAYDAQGRAVWTDDPHLPGATGVDGTNTVYDAEGRVISTARYHNVVISVSTTGPAPASTFGTSAPTPFSLSSTIYDAQGRAVWADDTHLYGQSADGTHTVYDANGNVIATQRYVDVQIATGIATDGSPFTWLIDTPTELSTTETLYDAAGRVVWTDDVHAPGATGVAGTHTTYNLDGTVASTERYTGVVLNLLNPDTTPTVVLGSPPGTLYSTTSSTYDKAGRLATSTDALGHTTTYKTIYSAAGTLSTTVYNDLTTSSTFTDANGHKVSSTDQDGNTTTYKYADGHGDLTEVDLPPVQNPTNPTGPLVSPQYLYAYDQFGNMVSETDPNSKTTTYAYDALGRKISETLPTTATTGTPTETWSYDALGRLASSTDFDGHVITYAYDDQGRVTTKDEYFNQANKTAGTTDEVVTYTYDYVDGYGRLYDTVTVVSTANPAASGTTTTYYDVEGRTVEIDSNVGGVTAAHGDVFYGYNAIGQETDVTTASTHVQYGYDHEGRLLTVTAAALDGANLATPLVTTYAYNADGSLSTTSFPNGTVETRVYDTLGRLTSVATTLASATIAGFTYTLDHDGLRKSVAEASGRTDTYTYDADGRLTQEAIYDPTLATPNRTFAYTYDLAGNQLTKSDSGSAGVASNFSYTYDADGRLTQVSTTISGTPTTYEYFTYDAQGNTKSDAVNGQTTTYGWDTENRMISASNPAIQLVKDAYDDAGNRVSETVTPTGGAGQTTSYLNDPNQAYDQVLEEYATGGVLAATYVRGLDLLFQDRPTVANPTVPVPSYYVVDGLGSTRVLTSAPAPVTGAVSVLNTYTYDAFGNLLASTVGTPNEYQFAGYQFDAAIGQDYLRARYYNTATGQFTSRDSYEGDTSSPITINHYIYTNQNPVNGFDPSGHGDLISTLGSIAIVSAIGALAVVGLKSFYPGFFPRWFMSPWNTGSVGSAAIRNYEANNFATIERAGTYKDADLRAIFSAFEAVYPDVYSRACGYALDDLEIELKAAMSTKPAIRNGLAFVSASAIIKNQDEPDNILILIPNKFNNHKSYDGMANPSWYDTDEKRNIIFFYAGSAPLRPIGRMYNVVAKGLFGPFDHMDIPQGTF